MNLGFGIAPRIWRALAVLSLLMTAMFAVGQDAPAANPLASRVLIVFNRGDGGSRDVAKYYAKARGIPEQNLCSIAPIDIIRLGWKDYVSQVKTPIQKCLTDVGPGNILYIVFSYDTPFRVDGPDKRLNLTFAIDQQVTDIWSVTGPDFPQARPKHPYYQEFRGKANVYQPFQSLADYRAQPNAKMIYSVWRLDAANPRLAKGLVDKAIAAEKSGLKGLVCIDRRWSLNGLEDNGYGAGDWDLHRAADFAREAGLRVIEDANEAEIGTSPAPGRCDDVAMYAGWYSLNQYHDVFSWNTGAIGIHIDSLSAWSPRSGTNWSANAIKKGITVTTGSVEEPGLNGLVHPSGTFRDLFQGANVGDAFLRNTEFLKWVILYMGDPLYRPFPGGIGAFATKQQKEEKGN